MFGKNGPEKISGIRFRSDYAGGFIPRDFRESGRFPCGRGTKFNLRFFIGMLKDEFDLQKRVMGYLSGFCEHFFRVDLLCFVRILTKQDASLSSSLARFGLGDNDVFENQRHFAPNKRIGISPSFLVLPNPEFGFGNALEFDFLNFKVNTESGTYFIAIVAVDNRISPNEQLG